VPRELAQQQDADHGKDHRDDRDALGDPDQVRPLDTGRQLKQLAGERSHPASGSYR
jgi:hypothetical protein